MRKIILVLAMLVCGAAQATPTYSFLLETMVFREGYRPLGDTVSEWDFETGRSYLGQMRASIDAPHDAGWMELHYDDHDGSGSVTFDASNLVFRAIGGINTETPGCTWPECALSADFHRDGPGLSGSLYLLSGEMELSISGDRDLWSGTWYTDNPYGQYNITGRWHVVPLPGTFALIALGLIAAGRFRRLDRLA